MLDSYFSLNTSLELCCFIVAFVCLLHDKEIEWRLIILLLAATLLSETTGRYLIVNKISTSNHWLFNILMVFQITIIHIMFANLFKRYINSTWILAAGITLLSLLYSYDMLTKGFWIFSMRTFTFLSVVCVIYSFIYYYYLLTDDSYVDIKLYAPFWWVAGILLFSFGDTACNIFDKQLSIPTKSGHYLQYYIFRALNIILYSFWSFSFICRKWLYKPSQQPVL